MQAYKDDLTHTSLQKAAAAAPRPKAFKAKAKSSSAAVQPKSSVTPSTGGAPPALPNLVINRSFSRKKTGQAKRGSRGNQK